jgi:hypothetical protein
MIEVRRVQCENGLLSVIFVDKIGTEEVGNEIVAPSMKVRYIGKQGQNFPLIQKIWQNTVYNRSQAGVVG